MSVSPSFYGQLHRLLVEGLNEQVDSGRAPQRLEPHQRRAVHGINAFCDAGFSAPLVAVAAWEALLHELLLGDWAQLHYRDNPLWKFPAEDLEKWDIRKKTLLVPDFLLGRTFDKASQPFQDFSHLVVLRNQFVHFRHTTEPNSKARTVMKDLTQKGILLTTGDPTCNYPWPGQVACTEVIRWSINTLAAMARGLERLAGGELPLPLSGNFRPVGEAWVRDWYKSNGIDPDSPARAVQRLGATV